MLKDLFRSLRFFPVNSNTVYDIGDTREEEQDKVLMIMKTYWEHGWPDLGRYANQKGKCVELVAWYVDQWCQARIERQEAMEKEAREMEEKEAKEMEDRAKEMEEMATEMELAMEMEMERRAKVKDKGKGRAVEERPTSQTVYAFPETDLDFDF